MGPGRSAARARGRYRCFLPDLTGFTTSRCTEPGAQDSCYHSGPRWAVVPPLGLTPCRYVAGVREP